MSVISLQPDALSRVVDSLSGETPSELRQRAMQQFIKRGFPTTRDENWKYSDLSNIVDISERWLAQVDDAPLEALDETQIREIQASIDATWLVFANGHLHEELSSALTEAAISVTTIDDATDISIDEPLADLNAALMTDGIVIRIGENERIKKPVGLLFVDRAASRPLTSHARVVVSLDSGSSARFIEYHVSSGDANHYSNVVIDVTLGNGAELDYVRIQTAAAITPRHSA